MHIIIYVTILIAKILENGLATLRLIVVANGKKWFGAILNGVVALIWIITMGLVVMDFKKESIKIFFFVIGSVFGSYLGSYIESKLALGSNLLTVIVSKRYGDMIINKLRSKGLGVTVLDGKGKDSYKYVLMIMISRKKRHYVVDIIKAIDKDAMIVTEVAYTLYSRYEK